MDYANLGLISNYLFIYLSIHLILVACHEETFMDNVKIKWASDRQWQTQGFGLGGAKLRIKIWSIINKKKLILIKITKQLDNKETKILNSVIWLFKIM